MQIPLKFADSLKFKVARRPAVFRRLPGVMPIFRSAMGKIARGNVAIRAKCTDLFCRYSICTSLCLSFVTIVSKSHSHSCRTVYRNQHFDITHSAAELYGP